MTVKAKYSSKTEAERVLESINTQASGFFLRNNWYPISVNDSARKDDSSVLFPEINYLEALSVLNDFDRDKEKAVKNIEKHLVNSQQYRPLSEKFLKEFQEKQDEILKPVIKKSKETLTYLKDKNIQVTVIPTHFGTCGSFSLHKDIENAKVLHIELIIRLDQDPRDTIELYTSSITRSIWEWNKNVNWRETEAVSDFFTKYVFGYVDHVSTLDRVTKPDVGLRYKSIQFLRRYGLPTGEIVTYDSHENRIFVANTEITTILGAYEFRMLRYLIENRNYTVPFDELAEFMYADKVDEKYSLWGISKTVQRVRDKLEQYGVPRDAIKNVKGEGFKLVL